MKKALLKGLSEEQIAKAKACENVDDLLQLAKDEGVELNEEQLDAISGGGCISSFFSNPFDCPKCGSNDVEADGRDRKCNSCGHRWRPNG